MDTQSSHALQFCRELHHELSADLRDPIQIRNRVESLRNVNSFAESCFCKACVLPVVDKLATRFLSTQFGVSRADVHKALRCEGFNTPMYACTDAHAGFSSHSRSNSYHPGDKSGRRQSSRRSPDFCIRSPDRLRLVGELKYVPRVSAAVTAQVVHELRDYLSIANERRATGGTILDSAWYTGMAETPPTCRKLFLTIGRATAFSSRCSPKWCAQSSVGVPTIRRTNEDRRKLSAWTGLAKPGSKALSYAHRVS